MEAYDFSTATQTAYAWWQYELCDVFIELMKPVMARDEAADPGAVMSCRGWPRVYVCAAACASVSKLCAQYE